ncbi:MAG TPA: ClpXP protease specificity-enhancing factor SspB [Candidatus Sulfotelmatobacter sp.]|nr:ClpXP protease specificity-enhancing factor SspB [Candidatus Sulfotelmatobacter sp.]
MPINQLRYDQMIEEALRGVVRRALRTVTETGLPGSHHFYITFKTTAPGVELAPGLKEKYPEEMTIVLQHQFWGLEVGPELFAVTLKFNEVPERLVVPFAAVTAFADPAAKFGLQFQQETGAAPEEATGTDAPAARSVGAPAARAKAETPTPPAADDAGAPAGDAKVVALDNFRRK